MIRTRDNALATTWLALVTLAAVPLCAAEQAAGSRPNVLFVSVDDLRPVLGCYGHPTARTPHIDALAGCGMLFERAYCQVASCNPSRTAVLTGLRPQATGVITNASGHFRTRLPDCVTLPGCFKQHGYCCKELGKVFHVRDAVSWSEPKWIPPAYAYPIYGTEAAERQQRTARVTPKPDDWWGAPRWIKLDSWAAPDVPDEALFDGQLATQAIAELRRPHPQPFFLAVGFFRPHLPFIAPRKYFELYPPDSLELLEGTLPSGAPELAAHASPEPRTFADLPRSGEIPIAKQKELLRAYLAAVSYVDAQVGRVLEELDALGLRNNTLVVLWSDHGYHLGDHGLWGKYTNFETATRSTLMVAGPSIAPGRTRGLVELVDIYPTLCQLCGVPTPDGLAGESFLPLLRNPAGSGKPAAFSQASPRGAAGSSVRTDRYRYTQWRRDGQVVAEELYDYRTSPSETVNLAATADAGLLAALRATLATQLPAETE